MRRFPVEDIIRTMQQKLLVMGGTWFLGRATAEAALRLGWDVTVFNRGRSRPAPQGARQISGDRTSTEDLRGLAEAGPWDAVIDTSASELPPEVVSASSRALKRVVARYVYVSTVNAYEGWPRERLTEDSAVYTEPPSEDAPSPEVYGRNKATAERNLVDHFGPDRSVILRPGVILGPGEYVGRLPWWLRRAARGGEILAPGRPEQHIQPIDVRDVARFALEQAAEHKGTAFNLAAPLEGHATMEDLLQACIDLTGSSGKLRWASNDLLSECGVREWTELPLWRLAPGAWAVDSSRAAAAGLRCRPLRETVSDTWEWLRGGGAAVPHPRSAEHGISEDREAAILAEIVS